MEAYNSRAWLNKPGSPSRGNVVAFDGSVKYHDKDNRATFLSVSDCYVTATLHKTDDDTTEDFIQKMKTLRNEIDSFIDHLETTSKQDQLQKSVIRDYL